MNLTATHISHWFGEPDAPGRVHALDDVDVELRSGEIITVVGASGCGKTTLLRIIAGLLQPTTGEVRLGDDVIDGPDPRTSVVFQSDRLLPWKTTLENARLGADLQGRADDGRARHLLELVGLQDFLEHRPAELSGGMKQRVNLARALATDPRVLLMDEPFAALDAQTREVMQSGLLSLLESGDKSVLFITHQIDEAVFLGDRVVVLSPNPGRLQEVVDVDLPRPRSLDVKRDPEFRALVDHVWGLIQRDVFSAESWALGDRTST